MKVLHLSTECFPAAKVGGLADVVGALPKFQNQLGVDASVVMPWYDKEFVRENNLKAVAEDRFMQGSEELNYVVYKVKKEVLGFPLYMIKIPGKLDRPKVYAYADEDEQWIAFQHAFLHWLKYHEESKSDILHCHDHHMGLIPFLTKYSDEFSVFSSITTVFTVHNGQYQGWLDWNKSSLIPAFDTWKWGLMDWDGQINPLATAIKCADAYTTVSEGYLQELFTKANGLESLFKNQSHKGHGIVNGIDTSYWSPETDNSIHANYKVKTVNKGKKANKQDLCAQYNIPDDLPLISFIGRCAFGKGADLLNPIFFELYSRNPKKFSTFILGSGNPDIEESVRQLQAEHQDTIAIHIGYDESLAHKIYASSDMLIMPSRVEPCGLNQLYALKYGTIPIVRNTGGLHDTVIDTKHKGGYGFVFESEEPESAAKAVERALETFGSKRKWGVIRARAVRLDFSWNKSAQKYIDLYKQL
jgi:starch synthase